MSSRTGDPYTLRLGSRGSRLALAQSHAIAKQLETLHVNLKVEVVVCRTTGDRVQDRPLQDIGGKGLFVKEIEEALLDRQIDCAVHSLKDVPVTEPLIDVSELTIAAVPTREDVRDVLIARGSPTIASLPYKARIGTSSLRRKSQLLALRQDLRIEPLRGNIDTRLNKIQAGEFDATILALAGLKRAGLLDESWMVPLDLETMVPAPGQGALALQCRLEDSETIDLLRSLNHPETHRCTDLERGVVAALGGDCHSPIAAYASESDGTVALVTRIGQRDGGGQQIKARAEGPVGDSRLVLGEVIEQLRAQHVEALLGF